MQPAAAEIDSNDRALVNFCKRCREDPELFVEAMFPWGRDDLAPTEEDPHPGPDAWQRAVLKRVGQRRKELRLGLRKTAARIAVRSGHGPGKSALIAWLIYWFMSTTDRPRIVATANTASQLEKKTWMELGLWHKRARNRHWFIYTATQLMRKGNENRGWRADAIPWSEHRSEAFAGTHAEYVMYLFDEASAIPDTIWEVSEGAMTTKFCFFVAFGNPTRNTGKFRDCFRSLRHRWDTMKVDARTAKRANRAQLNEWIEDYGEDSDFSRIRVKGDWPRTGEQEFIPEADVWAARQRRLDEINRAMPKICACDVARGGGTTTRPSLTVISVRQGPILLRQLRYPVNDLMLVVGYCTEVLNSEKPDAFFIDANGIGAGVYDRLRQLGYNNVHAVYGSETAERDDVYHNKRVECWGLMRDWLKRADIPDDQMLADDLVAPKYGFDMHNRFQLESKEDMIKRNVQSPDSADSLSLTFAERVAPKEGPFWQQRQEEAEHNYDPYAA